MSNVMDYVKKYGSCAFTQMPFSSVDALILAQLSYIKYSELFYKEKEKYEKGEINLKNAIHILKPGQLSSGIMGHVEDEALLLATANSVRFANICILNYVNLIDPMNETQFSAVTFVMDPQTACVAFRGTDQHLLGWKENIKLAFSEVMLSQKLAKKYLEITADYFGGSIYVVGHSKGGTLAAYASTNADEKIKNKIIRVYCFDTPQIPRMNEGIADKLTSIVPKDSLVGLLFGTLDSHIVVDSNKRGIWQHDPYSWKIQGEGFVYLLRIGKKAMRKGQVFNRWVGELSLEEKRKVAQSYYEIMEVALKENPKHRDWLRVFRRIKHYKLFCLYLIIWKKTCLEMRKREKEKRCEILKELRYILDNIGENG